MALTKAQELVSSNSVVVFSKTNCPFCVNVKQLLTQLGVTYKAIELDKERSALRVWGPWRDFEVGLTLYTLGATYPGYPQCRPCDGAQIQSALGEWTGQRTVPNVFIGGNHIGGCDKTTALHKEGKLVPLLTQAGAVAKTSA